MRSNFISFVSRMPDALFLFWTTLIFYSGLLVTNAPTKVVVVSFVLLFTLIYFKLKSLSAALFFTFVISTVIHVGKSYPIQLITPGVFPLVVFPNGYFINLVVTPYDVISFFLLVYMVRQIVLKKIFLSKINYGIQDFMVMLFFATKFLSALISSSDPALSFTAELLWLNGLIVYMFGRLLIKPDASTRKLLVYVFSALILFESLLSAAQLINKSPLYKSIESQVNFEYFGKTVDESEFTFRPVGTFDHANTLGVWLASLLVFVCAFAIKEKTNLLLVVFLSGTGILLTTLSRSGWVGYFVGLIIVIRYLVQEKKGFANIVIAKLLKFRYLLIPAFLFLTIVFVLPRIEKSFYSFGIDSGAFFYRKIQVLDAIEVIKMHPILGVGNFMGIYEGIVLNLYTFKEPIPLAVHNWYLNTAVENGIFAVFAFIYFILLSAKRMFNNMDKSTVFSLGCLASIACLMAAGLVQPYINITFLFILLSISNSANMIRQKI